MADIAVVETGECSSLLKIGRQSRSWVFVIWTQECFLTLSSLFRFVVYQPEVCATTGRNHLQGFLQTREPLTQKQVALGLGLKVFARGSHADPGALTYYISPARGSAQQNISYCSSGNYCRTHSVGDVESSFCKCELAESKGRTGPPVFLGLATIGAGRPKLGASILQMAEAGQSFTQIVQSCPDQAMFSHAFIEKIVGTFGPVRSSPPIVWWLHGSTGTNKTRLATAISSSFYLKAAGCKWFDGYQGQSVLVLDELRPRDLGYPFLLQLLDRYPLRVEIKGSSCQMKSHFVVITSPNMPREFCSLAITQGDGSHLQLERRISKTVQMNGSEDQFVGLLNLAKKLLFEKQVAVKEEAAAVVDLNADPELVVQTVDADHTGCLGRPSSGSGGGVLFTQPDMDNLPSVLDSVQLSGRVYQSV